MHCFKWSSKNLFEKIAECNEYAENSKTNTWYNIKIKLKSLNQILSNWQIFTLWQTRLDDFSKIQKLPQYDNSNVFLAFCYLCVNVLLLASGTNSLHLTYICIFCWNSLAAFFTDSVFFQPHARLKCIFSSLWFFKYFAFDAIVWHI